MSDLWYRGAAILEQKKSKSIIHPFTVKGFHGLTINPYHGCGHRCGYCYATYEWSPEFYDKIYAKSNAAEILDKQLANWKSDLIEPIMVSSATDAYQPAELRYELTRKCVRVLQKYNAPYIIFTKSAIIERDLELHKKYKQNCIVIWSITTCNESIRRVIEPGTPPADRMFEAIRKFTEAGVCCAVNVDPIMPLITDTPEELEAIVSRCKQAGLSHVFGELLRLRIDIWERMKLVLRLLEIHDGASRYRNIYNFEEPLDVSYAAAERKYAEKIVGALKDMVRKNAMNFAFPSFVLPCRIDRSHLGQTTMPAYLL